MKENIYLMLLIYDNINNKNINELVYKFQCVNGLSPDILISYSSNSVALRWTCDDYFPDRASIIHVALNYIYTRFFNLLFSIKKPFAVYSNADLSYLMLLGTFIPSIFPVEKIQDSEIFMNENKLFVNNLANKYKFSFYDLYKEHCAVCYSLIEQMKNNHHMRNAVMTMLSVYYQSSYALLQAVLFSDEKKQKKWDEKFFGIKNKIKDIQMPDNDSWLTMMQNVDS